MPEKTWFLVICFIWFVCFLLFLRRPLWCWLQCMGRLLVFKSSFNPAQMCDKFVPKFSKFWIFLVTFNEQQSDFHCVCLDSDVWFVAWENLSALCCILWPFRLLACNFNSCSIYLCCWFMVSVFDFHLDRCFPIIRVGLLLILPMFLLVIEILGGLPVL